MDYRTVVCILLLAVASSAAALQKPAETTTYDALVQRAKTGDQTVDFRELRLAFANSPAYDSGPDTTKQKTAMTAALNAKDFPTALKNAETVLASNYVDMDAHVVAYVANQEMNNRAAAELHKFILTRLLDSITGSGDGKTPETAYQVIDVHEEYVLLRFMHVGLPESQSLLHKGGHSYDEIEYKDPTSQDERTMYFNVDIPVKHGR